MKRYRWIPALGTSLLLVMLAAGPAASPAGAGTPPAAPLAGTVLPARGIYPAGPPSALPSALTWKVETVDAAKAFRSMEDRSLALDAQGHPHIAYGDDHLFYAWYDGLDWRYETVDTAADVGEHAALDLDAQGRPHISYYDRLAGSLRHAFYDGTAWRIEVVDSAGSC